MVQPQETRRVVRATGATKTERHLGWLADYSFLSLWSYPSVYRDQGAGQADEVCDLLVVFDDNVIVFSDKDVAYPDSGDPDLDWQRWYRRAIRKSAAQVWGAERWIREHPDRLFLDRSCSSPFPIPLPPADRARFHRVVVAHDTSGRRRALTGGSGSLILMPDVVGDAHLLPRNQGGRPLAIGDVEPKRGYVHVLDEVSLEAVLRSLDTASDFVAYLEKKERLIRGGRLYLAHGEEDLLAYYLKEVNEAGEHDFVMPDDGSRLLLEEGHFANFIRRPEYEAKVRADRVSYLWDAIIEDFSSHARDGTLYDHSDPSIQVQERILRSLAREPRVRRRLLAKGILEKLSATPSTALGLRALGPSYPGDPWYVFVCVPRDYWDDASEEEYRRRRVHTLHAYAKVLKLKKPDIETIVGIGTEAGLEIGGRSHDLILADCRDWTEEDFEEARQIQEVTGFLKNPQWSAGHEDEYPVQRKPRVPKAPGRNDPCPCGSGKKFKKCCLWK